MHVCPTKFLYAQHMLPRTGLRILDIGCGNNSPSTTKNWFPGCYYAGADIENYNNAESDLAKMDVFYQLGTDGSGYSNIPDGSYDYVILHHVVEHMTMSAPILATLCSKIKPGGYIWIAFPSLRSLSLPPAEGSLHFCDDPTHVYVPSVREIANVLLANGVKILDAGRSRSLVREMIGLVALPWQFLRKLVTGRLSGKGLWYILGFEDHVFGQRRLP
jgi:SAM-dependent methyltransferase